MLIGVSGKIGSGKDTIGSIIQYLTSESSIKHSSKYRPFKIFLEKGGGNAPRQFDFHYQSDYEIKKYADSLKDIVCLLIGCTREQLEDHEFKDTELGEEWIQYAYADGFDFQYRNGEENRVMNSVLCDKEQYEYERGINWQTAYKTKLTPRILLQVIGTNLFRDKLLPNIWVNALFSKYRPDGYELGNNKHIADVLEDIHHNTLNYPNWCITDMRFPNELEAIKKRGGISIRVNRDNGTRAIDTSPHASETALDNAEFDYIVDNNGSIEELIDKVKEILITEKII
jgi:hypothetical protein